MICHFIRAVGGGNLKYIECVINASSGSTAASSNASLALPSKLVSRVELIGAESLIDTSNITLKLYCYDGKRPYGNNWTNKLDLISKTVKRTTLETNPVTIDVPDEAKTREWLNIEISGGNYNYGQCGKLRLYLK